MNIMPKLESWLQGLKPLIFGRLTAGLKPRPSGRLIYEIGVLATISDHKNHGAVDPSGYNA